MKKILVAAVIILSSITSEAQFRIGTKGGLSFTDQSYKDEGSFSTKQHTEMQSGIIGDLRIGKKLYLQPQLLYSRKGATHESNIPGESFKLKMNYFELPLNLVYKQERGLATVFIGGGPVISYGFGGELIQNGNSKKIYDSYSHRFRRDDISANFTAGVELNNGMFAAFGFQHGFRDISNTADANIKNRSASITFGYFFPSKKRNRV